MDPGSAKLCSQDKARHTAHEGCTERPTKIRSKFARLMLQGFRSRQTLQPCEAQRQSALFLFGKPFVDDAHHGGRLTGLIPQCQA